VYPVVPVADDEDPLKLDPDKLPVTPNLEPVVPIDPLTPKVPDVAPLAPLAP
jgi:hypothetical protein